MADTVEVGMTIVDNDPRMLGRELVIVRVGEQHVHAMEPRVGMEVRILRRRIYTDGKPRRTGFSVVSRG